MYGRMAILVFLTSLVCSVSCCMNQMEKLMKVFTSVNHCLSIMPVTPFLIVRIIYSSSILYIRPCGQFQFRINFSRYESVRCLEELLGRGIGIFEWFHNFK
jgi:hypothetical protein